MGSCVSLLSTGTVSTKRSEAETISLRTSKENTTSSKHVDALRVVNGEQRTVGENTNRLSRQKSSVRCIAVASIDSTADNGVTDGFVTSHSSGVTTVHVAAPKGRHMGAVSHGAFGPGLSDSGNVDTGPTRRQPGSIFGVGGGAGSRLSGRISSTLSRYHNDRRSIAAVEEEEENNGNKLAAMHRRHSLTKQWVVLCLQTNTQKAQRDGTNDSMYYSNDSQELSPIDDNIKITSFPEDASVDFRAKSAVFNDWISDDSSDAWSRTLKDDDSLFAPASPIDRGTVMAVGNKVWFPQSSCIQTMDRPKAAVEGRRSKPVLTVR